MVFLIEPAADLIVPLCRIANRPNREDTEKFFLAALRTALAAGMFFLFVTGDKVIEKTTVPLSMAHLIGRLGVMTIAFYATATLHPYAATISSAIAVSYCTARRENLCLAPLQIAAIVCGLYAASIYKSCLPLYPLDQQIFLLSKNLAAYFFTTTERR